MSNKHEGDASEFTPDQVTRILEQHKSMKPMSNNSNTDRQDTPKRGLTLRERIKKGECVSPLTADKCPVCIDHCEASDYAYSTRV